MNNLKKFEDFINEGMFKASIQRSNSKELRKEEYIDKYNIQNLNTTSFLGNVYWANECLTIDNEPNITIEEFKNIPAQALHGWRLPTRLEFMRLMNDGYFVEFDECSHIYDNPLMDSLYTTLYYSDCIIIQDDPKGNIMYMDSYMNIKIKKIAEYISSITDDKTYYTTILLVRDKEL